MKHDASSEHTQFYCDLLDHEAHDLFDFRVGET